MEGVNVVAGGCRGSLLKRFALFSYLNHSFILSLNVKVCIRFIVFLQISLCFLFVNFRGGKGSYRFGGRGGGFLLGGMGGSVPHYIPCLGVI